MLGIKIFVLSLFHENHGSPSILHMIKLDILGLLLTQNPWVIPSLAMCLSGFLSTKVFDIFYTIE